MLKRNSTVRWWLVALVAATLFPTLITAAAALLYAYKEEQAGFQRGLGETTRALALVVDREIARREAIALTLAGSPALTLGDLRLFHEYARQIAPTRDKVVVLHDLTGKQLVNTRLAFGAALPESRNSAERVAAGPLATVVSNVYFAPVGQQYSFFVQVPVLRDGKPVYFLSVAGYASALQSIMVDQKVPDGWIASILDAKGVIVARNREPERFVGKPTSERLTAQMGRRPEGAFESSSIDGVPILAAFSKSPSYGWSAVVGVPLSSTSAPLKRVGEFAGLALLLLSSSFLLAISIGRRLIKPVERLRLASQALGDDQPIDASPTGLRETDQVLTALVEASAASRRRRVEAEATAAESKKAEDALRQSEERLRDLANTIPNLAWMANADGWITWYNDRWYDYTGTTHLDMEGWGWQKVHAPETLPAVMARWQESIRTGQPFEMTFPLLGKDGIYRPFFTRVAPLRDVNGEIVQWFGTNTDVSSLKKAEEELRAADRKKDEFLAMLAHELRNPLAPIRNCAELLHRAELADPSLKKAGQVIARQVAHMTELLDDLLDVSRITRGLIALDMEVTSLGGVIANAMEQARPLVEAKRHHLVVEGMREASGVHVLASPIRLTQVIANLLDNAAKYSEPGASITVQVRPSGGQVSVAVVDTGVGIAVELLPHVFEPFTQAERGSDRSQGGLGLGLTVVKGLIELQGGTVRAHSAGAGKGSTFTISMPIAEAGAEGARQQGSGGAATPRLHLLVVDDNVDAADTLATLLEASGHRVRCAYTGQQALAMVKDGVFDAAILDIGLPDMTGYQLAISIKALAAPVPLLLALSGYGQSQDQGASLAAGFSRHLVKPVDPQVLLEALAMGVQTASQL